MDIRGLETQSRNDARINSASSGDDGQSATQLQKTRAGHGGFYENQLRDQNGGSKTGHACLGLFALLLMLNAPSEECGTEWNLNAEKAILAAQR